MEMLLGCPPIALSCYSKEGEFSNRDAIDPMGLQPIAVIGCPTIELRVESRHEGKENPVAVVTPPRTDRTIR